MSSCPSETVAMATGCDTVVSVGFFLAGCSGIIGPSALFFYNNEITDNVLATNSHTCGGCGLLSVFAPPPSSGTFIVLL